MTRGRGQAQQAAGKAGIGTPLTYYRAFVDFALADPEHGPEFTRYLRDKLGDTR